MSTNWPVRIAHLLVVTLVAACGGGTSTEDATSEGRQEALALSRPAALTTGSLLAAASMRGFTLGERQVPARVEADYAQARTLYGANIERVGIALTVNSNHTAFTMPQAERDYMVAAVANGKKYGFKVVLTITAGSTGDNQEIWGNASLQNSLATIWAGIATQFKGNQVIAGLELLNEPVEPRHRTGQTWNNTLPDEWRPLSILLINAIRAVDPSVPIVWMPSPWGQPDRFWSGFNNPIATLPGGNIVYSVHVYEPATATGQGINGNPPNVTYPAAGADLAYIVGRLQYVKDFGAINHTPIFVGEFGFNRHSPAGSREAWFTDTAALFESYGWNYAAHAFRNWEGWDTEIGPDPETVRRPDAPIITILKNKFSANR